MERSIRQRNVGSAKFAIGETITVRPIYLPTLVRMFFQVGLSSIMYAKTK
jgi:hypothetical protein